MPIWSETYFYFTLIKCYVADKWTIKMVEELVTSGKIRGFTASKTPKTAPGGKKVGKHYKKRGDKAKDWMGWYLFIWCQDRGIVLEEEYFFHPERMWRSDYAVITPYMKILIEYEGLMSEKSRHTTVTGYTGDTEKYNAAAALGFQIIRFTTMNYKTLGKKINELELFYKTLKSNQQDEKESVNRPAAGHKGES